MGKKLPPSQLEFYRRVDEILYYKWDPIGVSESDWARDEYQSYLPRVFALALEGASSESIANYLGVVSTESMGLSPAPEHDLKIAQQIIEVKEGLGL